MKSNPTRSPVTSTSSPWGTVDWTTRGSLLRPRWSRVTIYSIATRRSTKKTILRRGHRAALSCRSAAPTHIARRQLTIWHRTSKSRSLAAPHIAVTSFESSNGLVTVHEVDPIVECSPEAIFPPNTTTCKEFVSTGVQLERTWQTSNANHVAWMTDTWRSTDGAAHSLNALYDQETVNGSKEGAYKFPGASAFSAITKEEMIDPAPGPGGDLLQGGRRNPQRRGWRTPPGSDRLRHADQRTGVGVPRNRRIVLQRVRDALPANDPSGWHVHAADGLRPGVRALRSASACQRSARQLPPDPDNQQTRERRNRVHPKRHRRRNRL